MGAAPRGGRPVVRKISIDLTTTFAQGSSTEGRVYLGLGGREFCCDIDEHADFAEGDETTYEFGEDSNVLHPERNDPRQGLPLSLEDVTRQPVYVRLDPGYNRRMLSGHVERDAQDDWNLGSVRVRVLASEGTATFSALDGSSDQIWLGPQSGLILHLRRTG